MEIKEIRKLSDGVIRQYKYDLKQLEKKYNIRSEDDLYFLTKKYFQITGSISSLEEMNEYIDENQED